MRSKASDPAARVAARNQWHAFAGVCLAVLGAAPAHAQPDAEFVPLFDGSFDGWTIENTAADNFTIADSGVLEVDGPQGWLKSQKQYADFRLRVEFRFVTEDGDSGIFVRARPDAAFSRGWPNNSYQVQLLNPTRASRFPPVGSLFRHGTAQGETQFDPEAARRAFTGTGEWQLLLVEVVGDRLTAHLNGALLLQASNIVNPTGYIGIQGETDTLQFRKIEIDEL